MLDKVIKFFITLTFIVGGGALMRLATPWMTKFITTEFFQVELGFFQLTLLGLICILVGAALGGIGGWLVAPVFVRWLRIFTTFVERQLSKMPINDVIAGASGLAIGLIIANLLGNAFSRIPAIGNYLPILFSVVLGYLGIRLTISKRKELAGSLDFVPRVLKDVIRSREAAPEAKAAAPAEDTAAKAEGTAESAAEAPAKVNLVKAKAEPAPNYKLLDTNVIIDGRIADICRTGFLEGRLLIPVFVLEELQHIADSPDSLRRVRGRRGLDVLQKIREDSPLEVEIMNVDFEDIHEVDSKLVRLAQKVGGKIITNDFNLNKVAQLRGVEVLNINDLSNAVKAVVIPGETMKVQVVRDGKEPGQGVAYLDDGTMIVIENGHRYLSRTISVEVTSALQTSAGRMIFAKPR